MQEAEPGVAASELLHPQLLPAFPTDEPTCSLLVRIHLQPPQSAIKRPDKNTELLKSTGQDGLTEAAELGSSPHTLVHRAHSISDARPWSI